MANSGGAMNKEILHDISYGMYIVTTLYKDKKVGCTINTVMQITSENPIIAISLNKLNYTNQALKETKNCAISILSTETPIEVISKFGYFSSDSTDKFENIDYQMVDNLPIIKNNICGYLIGEVINTIETNTHDIFLISIKRRQKLSDKEPMTYRYYHEVLKGKSPEKAPTYIALEENKSIEKRYRCTVCGYIYDDAKEKIKFEDLPSDWKCPRCGVGKDKFIEL